MERTFSKTRGFIYLERIKKTTEIQNLFKKGNKVSTHGAKLFFLPNNLSYNRIAFALPQGFGNAIQRNYSKRISKEAYRHLKQNLKSGYDMVLLVYKGESSFSIRYNQLISLAKKSDLYE